MRATIRFNHLKSSLTPRHLVSRLN